MRKSNNFVYIRTTKTSVVGGYWGSLADYYDPLPKNEAKTPSALPASILIFYPVSTNFLTIQLLFSWQTAENALNLHLVA